MGVGEDIQAPAEEEELKELRRSLVSKSPLILSQLAFLSLYLADVAKRYPHLPELNILAIGMPNVGKSSLLNSLRSIGIPGREWAIDSNFGALTIF